METHEDYGNIRIPRQSTRPKKKKGHIRRISVRVEDDSGCIDKFNIVKVLEVGTRERSQGLARIWSGH